MSFDTHANLISVIVTVSPSPAISGITLSISNADATALATAGLIAPFNMTVGPVTGRNETNQEIIRVTSMGASNSGGLGFAQLIIKRQAESGGINRSIVAGDAMKLTITKKTIIDIETPLTVLSNFVVSGLTVPTSGNLTTTVAAGVVWFNQQTIPVASDGGHTYSANQDTYIDVNPLTGAFTYLNVANGANSPVLTASSIRLAKVVSSGSAITSVVQTGNDTNSVPIYPITPYASGGGGGGGSSMNACKVTNSAPQTITNAIPVALAFDTNIYDTNSLHNVSINNTRITIPTGKHGKWLFGATVPWSTASLVGSREIAFRRNGSTQTLGGNLMTANTNNPTANNASTLADLADGDYVEAWVTQKSGGNLNTALNDGGSVGAILEFWAVGPLL